MKKIYILLLPLIIGLDAYGGNYTVKVGEKLDIYCTAEAPAGYITYAFYALANPEDGQYLAVYSHSDECYATVTGIYNKSSVKIEVYYTYTYQGSYDKRTHVGHGTYYDYVTVTGGAQQPKEVHIQQSMPKMNVGEELVLNAILTPYNSSTTFSWGYIEALSSRGFNLTYIGPTATITATKPGTLYVVCQTANDLTSICIVEAVENPIETTSLAFSEKKVVLALKETASLGSMLAVEPANANSILTWTTSDESIVKVNSSGKLTAMSAGNAKITVKAENGPTASIDVKVCPSPSSITLPTSSEVILGYRARLVPSFAPSDAMTTLDWTSQNKTIAEVDPSGGITTKKAGTVTITVTSTEGLSASCNLNVVSPEAGKDYRNASARISAIKDLVDKTMELNR